MVIPERTSRRYQPYPEYKDSGVEWLGEIPAHWEVKRLKYTVNLINDKVENGDPDTPYIGLENIESWTGKVIESEFKPEAEGASNSFRKDDVLFGKLRPYLAKVMHARYHGICTSELMVLRTHKHYPRFLFYYMLSRSMVNIIDSSTYGVKMPRANWQFVGNLPALLPSEVEQQAIADFLDRETARIDELIVRKKRLIELLQEKRTALISHAVTKGLNPDTPMKDSGVEWLGEIPAYWELKKLKWTVTSCKNGIWGDEEDGENDVVCVRVADFDRTKLGVVENGLTWRSISENDLQKYKLQKGDLLLEKSGGGSQQPVGTVVLYELDYNAVCSNFIARMKVAEGYNARFLNYFHYTLYAAGVNVRSIKQTTGIQNLDAYYYLSELIAAPSIIEQQAIADYLDRETARIDTLISKINEAVQKLQEYRAALITAAVTGKIDVRSHVPREE